MDTKVKLLPPLTAYKGCGGPIGWTLSWGYKETRRKLERHPRGYCGVYKRGKKGPLGWSKVRLALCEQCQVKYGFNW